VYASLTRLPVEPRIHPVEAARIDRQSPAPLWSRAGLTRSVTLKLWPLWRMGGWSGARIYDALLLCCAARCSVDRIYYLQLADFRLLAPANLRGKVCAPW